jgi:hypothetical protein
MTKPTFFEGVAVALIAGVIVSVTAYIATSVFVSSGLLRLVIAGISFAYICYLLARSGERVGRLTVVVSWLLITGVSWVVAPSLLIYAMLQLVMIWSVRSLYYCNGVLAALADMALTGFSVASAAWAWSATHNVFLAAWCFFLTQALFVLIPSGVRGRNKARGAVSRNDDRFENAHHAAENALRKLMTH